MPTTIAILVKLAFRHGQLYHSHADMPLMGEGETLYSGEKVMFVDPSKDHMLIVRVLTVRQHGKYVVVEGQQLDHGDTDRTVGHITAVCLIP